MGDWFDKVKADDIVSEDASCGLEEMGMPDGFGLDDYDVYYTKECNLPVSVDFIFNTKATKPADYNELRNMKYEMRTDSDFRTSALFYFTRMSVTDYHRVACENLTINCYEHIVATFYVERFTPEHFRNIVQLMFFIKAVQEKFGCSVSINYNRVVKTHRETVLKYRIIYENLMKLTDKENLGSATLPDIVEPLLRGSLDDIENVPDALRNSYSNLVTDLWYEYSSK